MIGSELRWSDAPLGPPTKLSHALSFQPEKRILQGDLATIEPIPNACPRPSGGCPGQALTSPDSPAGRLHAAALP
jgi:hypothetical protein